jgi:hypothetical protein
MKVAGIDPIEHSATPSIKYVPHCRMAVDGKQSRRSFQLKGTRSGGPTIRQLLPHIDTHRKHIARRQYIVE